METNNPCLSCGACCAYYRASFYWAETDLITPNGVPVELTEKMNDFRELMRGSSGSRPRCVALLGIIGGRVSCESYERRASVCREFTPSWYHGCANQRCDDARLAWGVSPLLPGSWDNPGELPRAA
ncbi:YkgJ family cysteine cluster protein [Desulfurivibrio sp. D14AmB]|uniref:YkgJ family cysteine cluster protein n=1 Tax=Desulfurivibrio sp. D14AmB TaxID=3374370 RepID=UPI00376EC838